MSNYIAELADYLYKEKKRLTYLKCIIFDKSEFNKFTLEDFYDYKTILLSSKKTLDSILDYSETEEVYNKFRKYNIQIKVLDNLSIIRTILSQIYDLLQELDISDDSLADTVIISNSDFTDEGED